MRGSTIARPLDDRLIGGVCAALANYLQVDVTVLRVAFLVLALASGVGVVLYVALWLWLPPRGTTHAAELRRARGAIYGRMRTVKLDGLERHGMAIGLVAVGVGIVLASFGAFAWLTLTRAAGIGAALVGASMLFRHSGGPS